LVEDQVDGRELSNLLTAAVAVAVND
jgi:hypothetical protein